MTRRAFAAAATAIAIASASVLVSAVPANAATTIDDTTFYAAADFGVEAGGYPAGVDWFYGDVNDADGSTAFTPLGLEFNTGVDGEVQILNQDVTTPATAAALDTIVDGLSIRTTDDAWTFQLPFFAEGAAGFTTLRPDTQGNTETSQTWTTSQAIAATATTPAYAAGASAPFAALAAALYGDAAPTLLAYGFLVNPGDQPIIQGIDWDGTVSAFTPVWQSSATPTTITNVDFATPGKGLHLQFSGSLPGEFAYVDFRLTGAVDALFQDGTFGPVSATGTFDGALVLPTQPAPGVYTLTLDDDGYAYSFLNVTRTIEITVVAALAATGVDATLPIGIAVSTLLGGALLVFASRRRGSHI